MKIIIAGSRTFNDYSLLENVLNQTLPFITEVVSGTAKGADQLGERWAYKNNIKIKQFYPDWKTLGKSAGIKRNKDMADYADAVIAFWDGISVGTKHMIDFAKSKNLKVKIIYTKKDDN